MNSKTVFDVRMFEIDVDADEMQIQQRAERYMQDFLALTPDLKNLSGSYLKRSMSVRGDGLYFQILLCRCTAQADLPLGSTRRGFNPVDSFCADLASVNRSIGELQQIIVEAFNPEITAAELRNDFSDRHIAARQIARSRGPTLLNLLFDHNLTRLGPTMARGTPAQLTLRIDRLERRCARAEILVGIDPAIDLTKSIKLERKVPLHLKPLEKDPATYAAILRCIEQDSPINLPVGIIWRNTDGQIDSLEYQPL